MFSFQAQDKITHLVLFFKVFNKTKLIKTTEHILWTVFTEFVELPMSIKLTLKAAVIQPCVLM